MDQNLGRITPVGEERHFGGSGTCEGTPHEERKRKMRFVTEGNDKADELAKAGAMLDEGFMAEVRADIMKQERERRCTQPCNTQPVFTVQWNNGRTVKSLGQSRKKSGVLLTKVVRECSIEQSGARKRTGIDA